MYLRNFCSILLIFLAHLIGVQPTPQFQQRHSSWGQQRNSASTFPVQTFQQNLNFPSSFNRNRNSGWGNSQQQQQQQVSPPPPPTTPAPTAPPGSGELEYKHMRVLDQARGDTLEWEVNFDMNTITFTISAQTSSYIILGVSKGGQVAGADVVVGGTGQNGQPYLFDMFGVDNQTIIQDQSQDWRLISAQTTGGRSVLSVSRNLDTCDNWQDLLINNDLLHIIYGFGSAPNSEMRRPMQFIPQGSIRAYLLDPVINRPAETSVQNWRLSRRFRVPNRHTTYWCTIHRGLPDQTKNHIVGFTPYFQNERARRSVHHQLVYRCTTPPGLTAAAVFEQFVNHPGEECYLESEHQLPTILCAEILHIYGIGGDRQFLFPSDVGIPIGGENEYYMYETHIDRELDEVNDEFIIESGVDFHYSPQLRREEGSIFFQGYGVFGNFIIPPQTPEFNVIGSCSPECTREAVPESGTEIVATMLHAHLSTRRMRAKQYRGNMELPFIAADENYAFDFQEFRLLRERRTIMPGDQLASQCTFDTRGRDSSTVQGFSVGDEMCATFFLVNKRLPWLFCSSEIPPEFYSSRYGIQNMTWDVAQSQRIVRAAQKPEYVGRTFTQVADQCENWTPDRVRELEREQNFGLQSANCPNIQQTTAVSGQALFGEGLPAEVVQAIREGRPSIRTLSGPPEGRNVTTPAVVGGGGGGMNMLAKNKRMCRSQSQGGYHR